MTPTESTQTPQILLPGIDNRLARQRWLWIALFGSALILAPILNFGLGYDHGFFHYMAWANLEKGLWPYKDVWDTAFPGIILFHWLVLAMGGESAFAFRILDWGIQVFAAGLIFRLTDRIAGYHAAALAAIFHAILYTAAGYYHTAQRDGFLIPFMLLGILMFWHYFEKDKKLASSAGAGLAFGFVCLIRPTYALLAGVAALMILYGIWHQQTSRGRSPRPPLRVRLGHAALFSALCGLPFMLFILFYTLNGQLTPLIEVFTYLTVIYPDVERVNTSFVLQMAFDSVPRMLWIGVFLSAFSLSVRAYPWHWSSIAVVFMLCLLIRLIESKGYLYQYLPLFTIVSIAAGTGLIFTIQAIVNAGSLPTRLREFMTPILILAVIFYFFHVSIGEVIGPYRHLGQQLFTPSSASESYHSLLAGSADQADVARYIREHTESTDVIQTWGTEPMLYYAARRAAATRFVSTQAFWCSEDSQLRFYTNCTGTALPLQSALEEEFLHNIQINPPVYIIASYIDDSLAAHEGSSFAPDFPRLRDWLDQAYEHEATIGIWSIFSIR